ncbi:uncharacterized protein N7511_007798 [Penicillium nucicola]|uniref:uncharacterized protein n=1 Tax=Penicillium nucicola TaxID=1850975 RepID=UPI0025452330|nr:uncharacterized protein N7511_007798 [Penicillium nucicola]KAJ5753645.1 hypothetical protein N7511_007798 [Penicillium nucicola]
MEPPNKKIRIDSESPERDSRLESPLSTIHDIASLRSIITPPPQSRQVASTCPDTEESNERKTTPTSSKVKPIEPRIIDSPVQLTYIRDLPTSKGYNVDAVRLRDILGDPMIRECWQFNYLHDVDFLMSQFDEDTRGLVKVRVVHGSWQRENANKIRIEEACARYPNVEPIIAYMPEPFGTHHSKMMVLLRHDDLAQVIIHTANMIPQDWTNMTQAVWRSPLLPQKPSSAPATDLSFGSGTRFKRDFLAYLRAYGPSKTGPLVQQLETYDFRAVRAALVASVPSKQHASECNSDEGTLWGWLALKDLTSRISTINTKQEGKESSPNPHIVIQPIDPTNKQKPQISSVATLGQTEKWLKEVFFQALSPSQPQLQPQHQTPTQKQPTYSIIFPTPSEIRRSIDGYTSGASIHMKTHSPAQQKQLAYMRPYLCQWAGDGPTNSSYIDLSDDQPPKREAGRARAAPHIKTYIRFRDGDMESIDWAMVSSANLSTQAWGAAVNSGGEVRICSWEIGVAFWPGLFEDGDGDGDGDAEVVMVPTFQTDRPDISSDNGEKAQEAASAVVGFRMPYNLPLTPYGASDEPWCATVSHDLPDWRGQSWMG